MLLVSACDDAIIAILNMRNNISYINAHDSSIFFFIMMIDIVRVQSIYLVYIALSNNGHLNKRRWRRDCIERIIC